jgi:hypothetical protein
LFLGHYGVAFAAKKFAPRTSLGTLAFAAQFLDELWAWWVDKHRSPIVRIDAATARYPSAL